MPALLETQGIYKSFFGVEVLTDIEVDVDKGEIHGLVGENGAGKSTFCKIVAGVYTKDRGTITMDGEEADIQNPRDGHRFGIAMVQQEPQLVPTLTVAENLGLARGNLPLHVSRGKLNSIAQELLSELDVSLNPRVKASSLRVPDRQMVEIAKALSMNAQLIILDEPTAALSYREEQTLFDTIRRLRDRGVTFIYVSHVLDEIFGLCDRVTVLRDGEKVKTSFLKDITTPELVRDMVGQEVVQETGHQRDVTGEVVLAADNVSVEGAVRNVTFEVRAGEILGFYGLLGSGRAELLKGLFGAEPRSGGTVSLKGSPLRVRTPEEAMQQGLALITSNRREEGLMYVLTLRKNMSLPNLSEVSYGGVVVTDPRESNLARRQIGDFQIAPPNPETEMEFFSGGNQQKALLAKWFAMGPQVLLVDEPTVGVDVGAKEQIYYFIDQLAEQGCAVIVSSSYPPELLRLCDRTLVMDEGEVVAEFDRANADQEKLLSAALGVSS
jgi:ribose transport system ATP-binding protein